MWRLVVCGVEDSSCVFLDVRVFNPFAQSNRASSLTSTYHRHEKEKRRHYGQRVRDIEHAIFLPLVFSASGGMGKSATTFYKRVASLVSEKTKEPYSQVMSWIRCRLSFALLRSSIACLRGARRIRPLPAKEISVVRVVAEASIRS